MPVRTFECKGKISWRLIVLAFSLQTSWRDVAHRPSWWQCHMSIRNGNKGNQTIQGAIHVHVLYKVLNVYYTCTFTLSHYSFKALWTKVWHIVYNYFRFLCTHGMSISHMQYNSTCTLYILLPRGLALPPLQGTLLCILNRSHTAQETLG